MDMSQNYSIWPYKSNFNGKAENTKSTWICSKDSLSTSVLSTLMTSVKNISNWPNPGGQMMNMTQNYSFSLPKGNFPGKTKNNRSTWICSKYNLNTSLLSTLMKYFKNILNWPDPGGQMMDMTQNDSLWLHNQNGNFPGSLKTTEAHEYA